MTPYFSGKPVYPFGMMMEERATSIAGYRFGFNGHEKDKELSAKGNVLTAEFWQYDSRICRRWNLDPINKPWLSSYSVYSCNPIYFFDPNGADVEVKGRKAKREIKRKLKNDANFKEWYQQLENEDHTFIFKHSRKNTKSAQEVVFTLSQQGKAQWNLGDEKGYNSHSPKRSFYTFNAKIKIKKVQVQENGGFIKKGVVALNVTETIKISTRIPQEYFDKWRIEIESTVTPECKCSSAKWKVYYANGESNNTTATFDIFGGHTEFPDGVKYPHAAPDIFVIAMSIPITVKVLPNGKIIPFTLSGYENNDKTLELMAPIDLTYSDIEKTRELRKLLGIFDNEE